MKKFVCLLVVIAFVAFAAKSTNLRIKSNKRKVIYVLNTSWYGPGFHGKKTASGNTYNMYKLTAAHRTWPFGKRLILTNPINNKSTTVTINDRGPYDPDYLTGNNKKLVPHPNRDLDISFEAARQLGIVRKGVSTLLVEIAEPQKLIQ